MKLVTELNEKLHQAMREKDELKKSVLRLVKGEIDRLGSNDDQRVIGVIRKLVESNQQTITDLTNRHDSRAAILITENMYLKTFLPVVLTFEQTTMLLTGVGDQIKAAKNEGQAMGIAMKTLKKLLTHLVRSKIAKCS